MTKLSKDQQKKKDELFKKLEETKGALETALTSYNEVVGEVTEFRDEVVSEMDDYYSNKSDKWQEGEKGEAYSSWKDQWESFEIEEVEIDLVDEADFDALSVDPDGV
jgi:hypothetical protein